MGLDHQTPAAKSIVAFSTETLRKYYSSLGLSEEAAMIMSRGFREYTKEGYQPSYKRWISFAESRNIDSHTATINDLVDFFIQLFWTKNNPNYNRVLKARSALSSLFEGRKDNIYNSPILTRLFKGFFNLAPTIRRPVFTWSPDKVLDVLEVWPDPEDLPILQLAAKTSALILFSTGCRKRELLGMDIRYMSTFPNKLEFDLQVFTKTYSTVSTAPDLIKLQVVRNPNIASCPVLHLEVYLSRTKSIRSSQRVFISSISPYGAITNQRMAKWIKLVFRESGIVAPDEPATFLQSTRSAVSSALYAKGVPVDTILAHCKWKVSTFKAR